MSFNNLKNLKVSEKARLWIVASPSGGGKTSLVERLIEETPKVTRSISFTTRKQRDGEVDGVDYNFVSKENFQQLIDNNEMLEYEQVFGNYYGTSLSFINEFLDLGNDVILTIDWQGSQQVREKLKDTKSIFIIPPSIEALEKRLNKRGQDNQEIINARMAEAKEQISHYNEFDYIVLNDDFETAAKELHQIILADRLQVKRQQILRKNLLDSLTN